MGLVGGGGGGAAATMDFTGTEEATTALTGWEEATLILLEGLSSSFSLGRAAESRAAMDGDESLSVASSCCASFTAVSTSSKKASRSSSMFGGEVQQGPTNKRGLWSGLYLYQKVAFK